MEWTTANVWIQAVTGILGAHAAAVVAHDHRFGFLGHSLVGLIAGGLSGWFLQTQAITVVTGSGSLNIPRPPEVFVIQGLTGAVSGAIAMLFIGLVLAGRQQSDRS